MTNFQNFQRDHYIEYYFILNICDLILNFVIIQTFLINIILVLSHNLYSVCVHEQ